MITTNTVVVIATPLIGSLFVLLMNCLLTLLPMPLPHATDHSDAHTEREEAFEKHDQQCRQRTS
jgi:hypothetical protein